MIPTHRQPGAVSEVEAQRDNDIGLQHRRIVNEIRPRGDGPGKNGWAVAVYWLDLNLLLFQLNATQEESKRSLKAPLLTAHSGLRD